MRDAERYLGEHNTDVIYSWTPKEFRNFLQGAQLRSIDETEKTIIAATLSGAIARNQNKNFKPDPKKYFDAEKSRKEVLEGGKDKKKVIDTSLYTKAVNALKNFKF